MAKNPLGDFNLSGKLSSEIEPLVPNVGRSVEEIPLSQLDLEDDTFQTRVLSNLEGLKESIGLEGQQTPVLLRLKPDEKWQVVAGFRRISALKQLKREGVKVRLFDELSDEEAVELSILDNLYQEGLGREEIEKYQAKLRGKGILNPNIESFLQRKMSAVSLSPAPIRETEEEEEKEEEEKEEEEREEDVVYLEDLLSETYERLSEAAKGLDGLYSYWKEVSAEEREDIIAQCQYIHDLLPFLKKE